MKSLNRWLAGGLTMLFLLGLSLGTANADSSSKKKKKKEEKVVHHKHIDNAKIDSGVNNVGRPGYFFSDTAFVPEQHQVMGTAGIQFTSVGSALSVPFGGAYGIAQNVQIHASENFYSSSGVSGLGNIVFGGKYKFDIKNDDLFIAAGLDLSDGPLTGYPYTSFNFDPYGIVTYNFPDGLQLNGQLGIMVTGGYSANNPLYGLYPNQSKTINYGGTSWVQLNGGAAYPIADKLTGIAEIDINGLGSANTPLIVGVRTKADQFQLQAFGGLDLAGTVGIILGGNVALISE